MMEMGEVRICVKNYIKMNAICITSVLYICPNFHKKKIMIFLMIDFKFVKLRIRYVSLIGLDDWNL